MFSVFSKRGKLRGKVAILESSLKLAGLLNWSVNRHQGSVGRHHGGVGRHQGGVGRHQGGVGRYLVDCFFSRVRWTTLQ